MGGGKLAALAQSGLQEGRRRKRGSARCAGEGGGASAAQHAQPEDHGLSAVRGWLGAAPSGMGVGTFAIVAQNELLEGRKRKRSLARGAGEGGGASGRMHIKDLPQHA